MRRGWRVALASSTLACAAACALSVTGTADLAVADAGAPNGPGVDATTPPGSPPPSADGASDGRSGNGADASTDGSGTDSGVPDAADARPPPADARPPPPDTGTDAGTSIPCPSGGVVTDCAQCANNPLLCAMCKTGGVELLCVPKGSSCFDSYRTSGYDWCFCGSGSPSTCVLPQQECNSFGGGVCVTCGERQTQGFPCKGGGSCDEAMAKCK
jgi:hypothetical protein